MAYFIVDTKYIEDADKVAAVRPAHREYMTGYIDAGQAVGAGPWGDGRGGVYVLKVDDRADADKIIENDPLTREGIVVEQTVREWKCAIGPWAL